MAKEIDSCGDANIIGEEENSYLTVTDLNINDAKIEETQEKIDEEKTEKIETKIEPEKESEAILTTMEEQKLTGPLNSKINNLNSRLKIDKESKIKTGLNSTQSKLQVIDDDDNNKNKIASNNLKTKLSNTT